MTCIDELFVCDCTADCDDNSDEVKDWAACAFVCNKAKGIIKMRVCLTVY